MQIFALAALAIVAAQEEEATTTMVPMGDDCSADGTCTDMAMECANSVDMMTMTCQDCMMESRTFEDGSMFTCMADEMEGSATLAASAMAILAAATMMA